MSQSFPEPEIIPEPEPFPEGKLANAHTPSAEMPYTVPENGTGVPEVWSEPEPEVWAEPEPPALSKEFMPVLAVIGTLIGVMIMLENALVLLALLKGKPNQPRALSIFIGNLSVSDFLAGGLLIWFACFDYALVTQKTPVYLIFMCALWLVTVAVSVMALFNFAVVRLMTARSNEVYQQSKRSAVLTVMLSWIVPVIVLVIAPLAGWNCSGCMGMENCRKKCSIVFFPFTKSYVLILATLILFAILSLFIAYLWMLFAVNRKVNMLKKKENFKKKQKELIQSVLLILVFFTICILPIAVILLWDYIIVQYNPNLIAAFKIATVFSFLNSIFNPFVYIWRHRHMRSALWRALGRKQTSFESWSFRSNILPKIIRKDRSQKSSPSKIKSTTDNSTAGRKTVSEVTTSNKV